MNCLNSTIERSLERTENNTMSETCATSPSREVLQLAKCASKRMWNKRPRRDTLIQPLYSQLNSLRSVVPYSNQESGRSCVISDAMSYLEQMRGQVEELRGSQLARTFSDKMLCAAEVEVHALETGLKIHVSCEEIKKVGLIADMLEAMEKLGVAFEKVDISCEGSFILDAVCTQQIEGHFVETHTVKQVLLQIIRSKIT